MTKSSPIPPADVRVSVERRRSRAALLLAALAGTTALLGAATVALFCLRPELWRAPPRSTTFFRVQSRSMEPAFRGPRFVWRCPQCGDSFATTLDVDSSGGVRTFDGASVPPTAAVAPSETSLATTPETPTRSNANALNVDSPEVRKFRTSARFFPCPRCGFDRVPASSAVFQDGALVEATDATTQVAPQNADATQTATESSVWNDWRRRLERVWNGEKTELTPERWAVVVFRAPTGRATLKRVVGLPGETVEIVNGDVFVDGRVPQRSLAQIVETSTRLD
ncbi:MAG: hypothetical protein IJO46_05730, partial [Thermoguttaceae bacterium]|nr:hypothetical protein [Thermoguttaceae bacterium]